MKEGEKSVRVTNADGEGVTGHIDRVRRESA